MLRPIPAPFSFGSAPVFPILAPRGRVQIFGLGWPKGSSGSSTAGIVSLCSSCRSGGCGEPGPNVPYSAAPKGQECHPLFWSWPCWNESWAVRGSWTWGLVPSLNTWGLRVCHSQLSSSGVGNPVLLPTPRTPSAGVFHIWNWAGPIWPGVRQLSGAPDLLWKHSGCLGGPGGKWGVCTGGVGWGRDLA